MPRTKNIKKYMSNTTSSTEFQRWFHIMVKPERAENDLHTNLMQLKKIKKNILKYVELYNKEVQERNKFIKEMKEDVEDYREEAEQVIRERYLKCNIEISLRALVDDSDYPDELKEIELIDKN